MRLSRASNNVLIKKYGNRRLYDTRDSRYLTLAELAALIRDGAEVRVVDAKTGTDLTQPTLVQIILDSRGAAQLLPVDLLLQLVRMEDNALSEFFGRYMAYALDLYQQAKQGMQSFAPLNPFAANPLAQAATNVARLWGSAAAFGRPSDAAAPPPAVDAAPQTPGTEIDAIRRQVEELRAALSTLTGTRARPRPRAPKRR
ncbi:MAG: hypothetical protein HY903_19210 [Deltaproteobacteria bacterium]|nr:hypothetical protein [Deltaproteobacteria bacterium]